MISVTGIYWKKWKCVILDSFQKMKGKVWSLADVRAPIVAPMITPRYWALICRAFWSSDDVTSVVGLLAQIYGKSLISSICYWTPLFSTQRFKTTLKLAINIAFWMRILLKSLLIVYRLFDQVMSNVGSMCIHFNEFSTAHGMMASHKARNKIYPGRLWFDDIFSTTSNLTSFWERKEKCSKITLIFSDTWLQQHYQFLVFFFHLRLRKLYWIVVKVVWWLFCVIFRVSVLSAIYHIQTGF